MYSTNKLPQAKRDIEECFVYIGAENIEAAMAFLAGVDRAFEHITNHPFSGASRHYVNNNLDSIRMWLVPNFERYAVFYTIRGEIIDIVRVLHTARDLEAIFD